MVGRMSSLMTIKGPTPAVLHMIRGSVFAFQPPPAASYGFTSPPSLLCNFHMSLTEFTHGHGGFRSYAVADIFEVPALEASFAY